MSDIDVSLSELLIGYFVPNRIRAHTETTSHFTSFVLWRIKSSLVSKPISILTSAQERKRACQQWGIEARQILLYHNPNICDQFEILQHSSQPCGANEAYSSRVQL